MKLRSKSPDKKKLTFKTLVESVRQVHEYCVGQAGKAVNISLTIRNWIVGYYIEEYERAGVDRAHYGERLMEVLSDALVKSGLARCDRRELYRYRQFYLTYPQIVEAVSPQFPAGRKLTLKKSVKKVETVSPQLAIPGKYLIERLSFSHFAELLEFEDPLKRAFYEHECIKGNWSVRELKRQVATLYFERSGLSKNKKKLSALTSGKAEMNKKLFITKYQLELPKKEEIQKFLEFHMEK